jgi:serine/threonine protein phosphatase PrpC
MEPTSERRGRVSVFSAQGKRSHQEDRAVHQWIETSECSGWLLAVFDGHGGASTAQKAVESFPSLFEAALIAQKRNVSEALREGMNALVHVTRDDVSGSTASIVFIPRNAGNIFLAVLGDSLIAVQDAKSRIHIGPDHNVRTNLKERAAALARGGRYVGGYLEDRAQPGIGLQMTRVLGDAQLSRVVSREPEMETFPLGGHGLVLVGTDGLIDTEAGPNEGQLSRLLLMIQQGADAQALVENALRRQTGDNVSAVVWIKD